MSENKPTRRIDNATEAYREVLRWEEIARTSDAEKLKILRDAAVHASIEEATECYEKFSGRGFGGCIISAPVESEPYPVQEAADSKYDVREADLFEAVEFMQGKQIAKKNNGAYENESIEFTDGSKVECESRWVGPWSEVTPDVDARPPVFYIYEPKVK